MVWRKGLDAVQEPYRTVLEALLNELKKRFGKRLVSLVVFGSVARGTMKSDSDLDLLIVAQGLPRGRIQPGVAFPRG